MKRFIDPLDRVLRFRRLQMETIEAQLHGLAFQAATERHTAEERIEQAIESGFDLVQRPGLRGADVQITKHWLARLDQERHQALEQSQKLLDQHRQVLSDLIEARRKVELLETLRRRKRKAYDLARNKQLEAEAHEFHLARRTRTLRTQAGNTLRSQILQHLPSAADKRWCGFAASARERIPGHLQ